MIYKQAVLQFNKMDRAKRQELKEKVLIFAASERNVITNFNKHNIMCIKSLD